MHVGDGEDQLAPHHRLVGPMCLSLAHFLRELMLIEFKNPTSEWILNPLNNTPF